MSYNNDQFRGAAAQPTGAGHVLDMTARPAACSCGGAKFAGSPSFARKRHAAHVAEVVNGRG